MLKYENNFIIFIAVEDSST